MQKKSAQTSSSSPKTYHNVLVTIPEFSFLPQNILDGEPWKLPVPVCSLGENFFTILCKEYAYFMTDDAEALADLCIADRPAALVRTFRVLSDGWPAARIQDLQGKTRHLEVALGISADPEL